MVYVPGMFEPEPFSAAGAGPVGVCRDCLAAADAAPCPRCGSGRVVSHPELGRLTVAHVDCDAFYAAVEKRDRPELRERPVIVGHPGGRGVVTTACYVARRYGPRSAMPMGQALRLCPDAVVIPPDIAKYKAVSGRIRAILETVSPVIEPVALDEAYLDLADAGVGRARRLAAAALAIEREVGVTVSVGLGPNKFLAKLASDLDKPCGFAVIGAAEAAARLAPMAVRRIHGVGPALAARLTAAGITTIGQLQQAPEAVLVQRFGRFGRRLALYAVGADDRRVEPSRPTKSVSVETTFARDLVRVGDLLDALGALCPRLAERSARAGVAGTALVVKLKTADHRSFTRTVRLATPTARAVVIERAARPLVRTEADGRAFRLLGIGLAGLVPAAAADPPDLFDAAGVSL